MADDIVLNIVLNGLDDIIAQLQQAGQAGSTAFDALAEAAAKISGHADEASASIGKTAETTHAAEINVAALGEKGTRAFSGLASASEKVVSSVNSLSATVAIAAFEELGRTAEGVAGSFGKVGEAAAILLGSVTALGAGVAGAIYGLKELATSSAEDVVALDNVATQAGTTIKNIVGLRAAFAAAGVSSEGFAYSFKNLALRIQSDWPEIVRSVRDSADTLETDQIKIREATVGIATAQDQAAGSFIKTREAALSVSDAQRKVESSGDAIKSAQLSLVDAQEKIRNSYLARQQAALSVEQAEYNLRVAQGGGRDKDVEDALKLEAAELAVKKAKEQRREAAKGIERDAIAERTAQQGLQNAYAQEEKDTLSLQKAKLDLVAAEREQAQAGDKQRTAALEASAAQKKADDDRLKDLPAIAEAIQHVTSGAGKLQGDVDLGRVASGDLLKAIELNASKAKGAVDGLGESMKKPEGFDVLLQISETYQKLGKELDADAKSAITRLGLGRQATQELTDAISKGPAFLEKYTEANKDVAKAIADSVVRSKALIASQHELAATLANTKDLIGGTFNEDFTKGFDSLNQALTGNRENLVEFTKNLTNVHEFIQDLFRVLSGQPAEGSWMKTLIADAKEFYKTLVEIKDIVDTITSFLNKIGLGKSSEGSPTGFKITDLAYKAGQFLRSEPGSAPAAAQAQPPVDVLTQGGVPAPRDFSIPEQPQGPDERHAVTGVQPVPVTIVPSTSTPSVPGTVLPPGVGTEGAGGIVPLIHGANDVGAAFDKVAGAVDTFLTALNLIGSAQAAEAPAGPGGPAAPTIIKEGAAAAPQSPVETDTSGRREGAGHPVDAKLTEAAKAAASDQTDAATKQGEAAGKQGDAAGKFSGAVDQFAKGKGRDVTTTKAQQVEGGGSADRSSNNPENWDWSPGQPSRGGSAETQRLAHAAGVAAPGEAAPATPPAVAPAPPTPVVAPTITTEPVPVKVVETAPAPASGEAINSQFRTVTIGRGDSGVDTGKPGETTVDPVSGVRIKRGPAQQPLGFEEGATRSGHGFGPVFGSGHGLENTTPAPVSAETPVPEHPLERVYTDRPNQGAPAAPPASAAQPVPVTVVGPVGEPVSSSGPPHPTTAADFPNTRSGVNVIHGPLPSHAGVEEGVPGVVVPGFGQTSVAPAEAIARGLGGPPIQVGGVTPAAAPVSVTQPLPVTVVGPSPGSVPGPPKGIGEAPLAPALPPSAATPVPVQIVSTPSATAPLPSASILPPSIGTAAAGGSAPVPAADAATGVNNLSSACDKAAAAVSAFASSLNPITQAKAGDGGNDQGSQKLDAAGQKLDQAGGDLSRSVEGLTNAGQALSDAAQAMNQAASAVSNAASRLSTPGHAGGGLIHGPGTTTSDSIPARLSHGEYVVQARAVKHYGVNTMHAINQMHAPAMAIGGYIDALTGPAFKTGGAVKHDLLKTIETINQQHVQATAFGQLPGVTKAPGVQLKAGGLIEWLENPRSIPGFKAGGLVEWLVRPVSAPGFKAGGTVQHDLLKTMDVINQQHERATVFGQLAGVPKAPGVQLAEGGLVEWLSAPAFKSGGLVEGSNNMIGGGFEAMPGFAAGGRVDHVSQQHLTKTTAGASGPYASAGGSGGQRALTLVIEGKQFPGLSGPANVVGDMERHATGSRLSRISRNNPSWRK